jgi:hypothetical protein
LNQISLKGDVNYCKNHKVPILGKDIKVESSKVEMVFGREGRQQSGGLFSSGSVFLVREGDGVLVSLG